MISHDLITQTATSSVAVKSHKAIQFLHACFSGQHPRVRGQTMTEVDYMIVVLARVHIYCELLILALLIFDHSGVVDLVIILYFQVAC